MIKQKEIDLNNISLHPAVKIIFIQLLNYFKFTQIVPMVLLLGGLILTIIFGIIFLSIHSTGSFNIPGYFNLGNFNFQIGDEEIIKYYLLIALALDIVVGLINYLLKKRIVWGFVKKIKIILVINIIGCAFLFIAVFPVLKNIEGMDIVYWYILYTVLFILTIICSLYGLLISKLISLAINKINSR